MKALILAMLAGAAVGQRDEDAGRVVGKEERRERGGLQCEISAGRWFNNPVFRLNDQRDVYLFFFDPNEAASRMVGNLNRLHRASDESVVVGLTRAEASEVESFIRRNRVRFTVGARSRDAERFGIKELPALRKVVRVREGRLELEASGDELLEERDWGPYGQENVEALEKTGELMSFIESGSHGVQRSAALFKLFRRMDASEFGSFASELLEVERDPWVRNAAQMLIDEANGVADDQPHIAASSEYERMYGADPNGSQWKKARAYAGVIHGRSVEELAADYAANGTEEASEVLIRRWIVMNLEGRKPKEAVREALMRMLTMNEADHFTRLAMVCTLQETCEVGDVEAAELLERLAGTEPNRRHVRPAMEYAAHYLRTGEKDTRRFPEP